jgi:hypothetical protein
MLIRINQVAVINGIVSMKDEKEYLKSNININGGYLLICYNCNVDGLKNSYI